MKDQNNRSRISRPSAIVRRFITRLSLPVLAGFVAWGAPAAVQVIQFDPPLSINAFADAPGGVLPNILGVDFNTDGEVDVRVAYSYGIITSFFNSPTRIAQRVAQPSTAPVEGSMAAVPLGSIIGNNLDSSVPGNYLAWSEGYTNRDDLTQPLGDHEGGLITANVWSGPGPGFGGTIISFFTDGTPVTNTYYSGPVVIGDIAGKEGVLAVEFYVNGQPHFGYIHFDFRPLSASPLSSAVGVIHGWAYETEPGVAIVALPLDREASGHGSHLGRDGNKSKQPSGWDNRSRRGHPSH